MAKTMNSEPDKKPSPDTVKEYSKKWNNNEKYKKQEAALYKLFHEVYPANNKLEEILIKVAALNQFYSTQIYSIHSIAVHIKELNIDKDLRKGEIGLIDRLRKVEIIMNDEKGNESKIKTRDCYSFATKYCSMHNDKAFPIYDEYVRKMLVYYKKSDKFASFTSDSLRDAKTFKEVLTKFKKFYGLGRFSLKKIDQFLWQRGKEEAEKDNKNGQRIYQRNG